MRPQPFQNTGKNGCPPFFRFFESRKNGAGGFRNIRRETAGGRGQVETDAADNGFQAAGGGKAPFGENTAHLSAVNVNVVDPFDERFFAAAWLQVRNKRQRPLPR